MTDEHTMCQKSFDHAMGLFHAEREHSKELVHGLRHLAAICDAFDTKEEDMGRDLVKQIHMASVWLLAAGERKPTDPTSSEQKP